MANMLYSNGKSSEAITLGLEVDKFCKTHTVTDRYKKVRLFNSVDLAKDSQKSHSSVRPDHI